MDDIYVRAQDLNSWIVDHLADTEYYSISELIGAIEDMDGELNILREKYDKLKEEYEEYRKDNPPHY